MELEPVLDDRYLLTLIIASIIITYGLRLVGYFFSKKIEEKSELMKLLGSIATAFVSAMVAHIILFPVGSLINTELYSRVGALIIGVIIFLLTRKNLAFGVASSVATLILLEYMIKS